MSSVRLLIRRIRRLWRRTSRRRRSVVGAASTGAVVVVVMMVVLLRLRLPQRLAHIERVLSVGVVLGLDVVDLVPEGGGVEVEGGAVGPAHVEGDVLGAEDLVHGGLCGGHEFGGEPQLAVGAEDGEGGDVAVAGLRGVLLHLGEHVADDAAAVVLCDEEELRPREHVVEVVLHLVILRQAHQVARLHREQVVDGRLPDAHHLVRRRILPSTISDAVDLGFSGEKW